MDLRQLRYFIAVAEEGSVLAAARKVHISQPALSNRIKELEEELGAPLFTRHSRGVALTTAGHRLLEEARHVVAAMARAEAAGRSTPVLRELSIGASSTPRATIVPGLFELYRRRGGYRLNVQDITSSTASDRLSSGDVDAALCYGFEPRPGLTGHPLYSEDLYLVGSRQRIDPAKGDIAFGELANVPLVLDHNPTPMRRLALQEARRQGMEELRIAAEAGPVDMLATVLSQKRYCTIAAYGLFQREIARGELAARRICEPVLSLTLSLVTCPTLEEDAAGLLLQRCRRIVRKAIDERQFGWRAPDAQGRQAGRVKAARALTR
jgi:LysR family nitrogen assimilation transcriptional regulator